MNAKTTRPTRLVGLLVGLSALLSATPYTHAEESSRNVSVNAGEVLSIAVGKNTTSRVRIGVIDGTTVAPDNTRVEVRVGRLHHIVAGDGLSVITVGPVESTVDGADQAPAQESPK